MALCLQRRRKTPEGEFAANRGMSLLWQIGRTNGNRYLLRYHWRINGNCANSRKCNTRGVRLTH